MYEAVQTALLAGGSPGRGGHRLALGAGRRVLAVRESVARFFGLSDAARAIFTASATDSLNLALKGLLKPGDHCITTTAEHNALRRPLVALEQLGVRVTWLPVSPEGLIDPASVEAALSRQTRLIAVSHGSNVSGALQPIADLGAIATRAGVLLLVDAAQTAGSHPMDMGALGIHLLAAPGHKGLLGPQGTGILCVDPEVELHPIRQGGTGSLPSAGEQPAIFPEGFESGTLGVPGIAGLGAGIDYLRSLDPGWVLSHERDLAHSLSEGLRHIPGVTVYGPVEPDRRCGVVSFNVDGLDSHEVEERLDEEFGIIGRSGLHCNPGAHQAMGTWAKGGTMRLSPALLNSAADVEAALRAVAALSRG